MVLSSEHTSVLWLAEVLGGSGRVIDQIALLLTLSIALASGIGTRAGWSTKATCSPGPVSFRETHVTW